MDLQIMAPILEYMGVNFQGRIALVAQTLSEGTDYRGFLISVRVGKKTD